MAHPSWPLFDLRIRTPRLEIRLPTDADLLDLLAVIDLQGIHDPATMPFTVPWTDVPAPQRQRESLKWWWRCRAEWSPERWTYTGAVFVDGAVVGVQDLLATDFALLGSVQTGSWLGRASQGQGLGKEMRAAILHLAFAGLGAREAHSGAFVDNVASLATSRALGYRDNGVETIRQRDQRSQVQKLVLPRTEWESGRRDDIVLEGLDPCREWFGVAR
jgi:RimJ/RimL family protein N-acetyltransferase